MADKRCENGHFIDETWDLCPYCPQDTGEPEIPIVRPRGGEPPSSRSDDALRSRQTGSGAAPAIERTIAVGRIDSTPARRYVVGWLVGLTGEARGESYPIRIGRNVIGRDGRSDVVVNDDQASSHHADLVFRPDERRFILMDHNSTNGTYVDEVEIEARRDLAGREVVRIGSHRMLFVPLCGETFFWDDEGPLR